jgi:hypothetical protein
MLVPEFPSRRSRRRRSPGFEVLETRALMATTAGFPVISDTLIAPPDPTSAAGPDSLVAASNGQIELVTKTGIPIASAPLEGSRGQSGFFDAVDHQFGIPLISIYEPQALFDSYSQRFFIAAAETQTTGLVRGPAGATQSYLLLAVSKTSNPLSLTPQAGQSDWLFYSIPVTHVFVDQNGTPGLSWIDQPRIATDATGFYLTGDYLNFADSSKQQFEEDVVTRIDKNALLANTYSPANPSQRVDRLPAGSDLPQKPFALRPVQSSGLIANAPQLFVDAPTLYSQDGNSGTGAGVRIWAMLPTSFNMLDLTTVTAPYAFNVAQGAPEAGTSLQLDLRTEDGRLSNAVLQANSIWTAQTVLATDGATDVRWLQISLSSSGFRLAQSGSISPGPGIDTFLPSIAVDATGNLGIVYTQTSAQQFPALMFEGRRPSDPAGMLEMPGLLRASDTSYTETGFIGTTRPRFGSTSSISVDPTDGGTFWAFGEYAQGPRTWGTWMESETFATVPVPGAYDGNGVTEVAVYQPSTATWFIESNGPAGPTVRTIQFGQPFVDVPVPADYDGDGKTDLAVFRPTTGQWFILRSTLGPEAVSFGGAYIDEPVPADYDGDGKADLAVFRPGTGEWFISQSTAGPRHQMFGGAYLDEPIPADYDGDGKADLAVYRPSTGDWYFNESSAGPVHVKFGPGQFQGTPVPSDYDGDGKADLAVFSGDTATWSILDSSTNMLDVSSIPFGASGNVSIAVPGRYDGGNQAELAIYYPPFGGWFIYNPRTKATRVVPFGAPTRG